MISGNLMDYDEANKLAGGKIYVYVVKDMNGSPVFVDDGIEVTLSSIIGPTQTLETSNGRVLFEGSYLIYTVCTTVNSETKCATGTMIGNSQENYHILVF